MNYTQLTEKHKIFIEYLYTHYDRRNSSIEVCIFMFKKDTEVLNAHRLNKFIIGLMKEK